MTHPAFSRLLDETFLSALDGTPAPEPRKKGEKLTPEELRRFLRHCPEPKWKAVFATLYYTEQPANEVLRLRVEHVEPGWITFLAKGSRRRTDIKVQILPKLQPYLDGYNSPTEGWLFPSFERFPTREHASKWALRRVLLDAGPAAGLYDLTSASFKPIISKRKVKVRNERC